MSASDLGAARDELYGTQEAARFLGLHRSTLHVAVRQHLIVPDTHTPGGHLRFRRQTLEAYRARLVESSATGESLIFAQLRLLTRLGHLLATEATFTTLSKEAVASISHALPGIERCCIAVRPPSLDPHDRHALRLIAQQGFPRGVFTCFKNLHTTFRFAATSAMRNLAPEICADTTRRPVYNGTASIQRDVPLGCYAVMPILDDDEALGVLVCIGSTPHDFSAHDLTFLQGVADLLAASLKATRHMQQFNDYLTSSQELAREALRMRAHAATTRHDLAAEDAVTQSAPDLDLTWQRQLGEMFLRLSGAESICALGFGADLPTEDSHLRALACQACAGDGVLAHEQWRENGILHTGIGASVPIVSRLRAGVSARWLGQRRMIEADYALLASFASAYLIALKSR